MRRNGNAIIGRVLRERFRTSHIINDETGRIFSHVRNTAQTEEEGQQTSSRFDQHDPALISGKTAAIKDNFVTSVLPTTCASNILQDFSGPMATVHRLLQQAGVDIVAKTNMDEFGMGSHSINSAYGAVENPVNSMQRYSAGGSSGGSAVAVAMDIVDFALGSDTGGSVRLPAAYTQTFGFKPSYGRISRNGLIPYANSLDTVGIIAKSCRTISAVFSVLDQYDDKDPTSLSLTTRARLKKAARERTTAKVKLSGKAAFSIGTPIGVKTCRIGVPVEYNIREMHPIVRQSWTQTLAQLRAHGHEIVPVSLPTTMHALSAYYILAPAEASSNLAKYDGVRYGTPRDDAIADDHGGTLYAHHRGALFGEEVKRRILLGSYTLSSDAIDNYFIKAQKIRRLIQHDFNLVFRMPHPLLPQARVYDEGVDFIVCPTAPTPPPLIREVEKADPLESHINDVFTVPASLAGLPAINIPPPKPMGEGEDLGRLPGPSGLERAVGIQIIGQFGDDEELLRFAERECRRFNFAKPGRFERRKSL